MRVRTWLLLIFATILSGVGDTFGQEDNRSIKIIDIRVPVTLNAVTIDQKPTVYYEIQLTNFSSDTVLIKGLEVFDTSDSSIIFSLDEEQVAKAHSVAGVSQKKMNHKLPPNASSILYLEFTLPNDKTKVELGHRLQYVFTKTDGKKYVLVNSGVTKVSKNSPIVLGPPLKNGPWVAIYEPSWERGHRRVVYIVNDKQRIPGRFAVDFMKLDNEGRYAIGDLDVVKNWYGYGNDVLAVADGIVASVGNDFSESITISKHPDYKADQATGNYISIDIGQGHFVFYEHLQPNSIKVKPGQRVKRGEVIAAVGFTGQTTGPHLHFHVADANSALGAEGIPFVFDAFNVLGFYPDFENFGKAPWISPNDAELTIRKNERPSPNSVVEF